MSTAHWPAALRAVIEHPESAALLAETGITPRPQQATLKAWPARPVYEIP